MIRSYYSYDFNDDDDFNDNDDNDNDDDDDDGDDDDADGDDDDGDDDDDVMSVITMVSMISKNLFHKHFCGCYLHFIDEHWYIVL